jgi:replicative DNA helicase
MSDIPEIPHSREAEEAVLGAILINQDVYAELCDFLSAEDFYIHRLRFIWQAFAKLSAGRAPIDILTVSESLQSAGLLQEVGGPAFLTGLLNAAPSSLHAEAYAHLVREAAIRRSMLSAASQIATLAHDRDLELRVATEQSVAALEKAVQRQAGGSLVSLGEAVSQSYDRINALSRTPEIPGVATGLADLDLSLGNMQPGELIVLAARPGQGKTSLLLNIALHAAQQGKNVAFFSLEMTVRRLTDRLLSQVSGVDGQRINTGKLSQTDWPLLLGAVQKLEPLPMYLDEAAELTPLQLKARCRRLRLSTGKLDLVIVDYLQLMRAGIRTENRTQEVGFISRAVKALSMELDAPILVAAQLNRDVEQRAKGRPQLSDLRESGSIENDADVVIFLHNMPDQPVTDLQPVEIIIAKHRNGPTMSIPSLFRKSTTRFERAILKKVDFNA